MAEASSKNEQTNELNNEERKPQPQWAVNDMVAYILQLEEKIKKTNEEKADIVRFNVELRNKIKSQNRYVYALFFCVLVFSAALFYVAFVFYKYNI